MLLLPGGDHKNTSLSRIQNSQVYVYHQDERPYGYIVSQTMYVVSDINNDTTQAIEQDIRKHRKAPNQNGAQGNESFQEWLTKSKQYLQNNMTFSPNLRVYCNQMIYGTRDGKLQAKGGVLVEDRNTKISSQFLAMDLNSGIAELNGNTKVNWPKGNISAKSCAYDLQKGSLTCTQTDGIVSIDSNLNNRSYSPKYRIRNWSVYQQNDMELDSIFENLNHTCRRCMEDKEQVQSKSFIVINSDQLLLHLSQKEGMSDDWIAKDAKVYSPQRKQVSLDNNVPKLPFSIQAKKIAYGGKDLELIGGKLCLGERLQVPYFTRHICLNGLPFGNFQIGYQSLDLDGWYITKPIMKPLWFANHQAHLHVATLIRLSKERNLRDRFALACSLHWNDKNNDSRLMAEIVVPSPFDWKQMIPRESDSTSDIKTAPILTTTSSTLSSHTTIPSYSRNSRSYYPYSGDRESSLIDIHENGWNRCRAHFLLEKVCKKYNGKWNMYANWRTKVFNPATAYLETTMEPTEGNNNVKVSEWRELSHCLGISFSKNPTNTCIGCGQLKRQWEVGMESLKADRIQEMEYHYGFGVSDERQEPIQRTFANWEMEYLHFLWKEKKPSTTTVIHHHKPYQLPLSSFIAITGHFITRVEKLRTKPLKGRATCSIGLQGQRGKLRRKCLDFTGFSVQISQTIGALSTFLFEREEQRTSLNFGMVQQLYGNCRLGLERRWTWEKTVCWQPMETKITLQFLGDSYTIATSYWMEQGTAKLSCRWLW